jgi:hypothetical protein
MTNAMVRVALSGALLAAAPFSTAWSTEWSTEALSAQALSPAIAAERVQVLQLEQCQVQRDVRTLPSAGSSERENAIRALRETKDQMHARLVGLEARMDASPALRAVSDVIRESRLKEKLLFSRGTIEHWDDRSERRIEWIIQEDLAQVRRALAPGATPVECAAPA